MSEVVLHDAAAVRPRQLAPSVPSSSEFDAILRQADIVSRSGIVPKAYQTMVGRDGDIIQDKRPNAVVAALTGRTFGWDIITAMRNIHVIEGAATLKPEAMLGLIRGMGHRVSITRHADHVDIKATRSDTGDEYETSFSFEDGYRAGLCTKGDNGFPRARSSQGKPLPWEQYPVDMCQWRAVAQVARGLFGDIVLGLGYTPEELGAVVDQEGEVTITTSPMPTPEQAQQHAASEQRIADPEAAARAADAKAERDRLAEVARRAHNVPAPQSDPPRSAEFNEHAESWNAPENRTDEAPVEAPAAEQPVEAPSATPEPVEAAEPESADADPDAGAHVADAIILAEEALAMGVDDLRALYGYARSQFAHQENVASVLNDGDRRRLGLEAAGTDEVEVIELGALIMAAGQYAKRTGSPVRGQQ